MEPTQTPPQDQPSEATTQDYIDAIKDAKANGRALSINFGDLPDGVVASAIQTALHDGLPKDYADAMSEAASRGKTISLDFSQIQDPNVQNPGDPKAHFWETEKQPGLPHSPVELLKQYATQFKNAATSPMPGSLLALPVTAMQQTAQQAGADIARGTQDKIGVVPARIAGTAASMALDPTSYMGGELNVLKSTVPEARMAAVKAAEEAKIPLTPAEKYGSRAMAGTESALEKTITGSEPINAVRESGNTAMDVFKDHLKAVNGTDLQPSETGNLIKTSADKTVQTLKDQAQALYDTLPNAKAQPQQLRSAAENLLIEQYQLPKANRDAGLISMLDEYRHLGTKLEKQMVDGKAVYSRVENPDRYPSTNALQRMASDLKDAWRKAVRPGEKIGNATGRDATVLGRAIQKDLQQVAAVRTQLDQANKLWRQAKALDKNSLVKRLRTAGPEEATNLIFNGNKVSNVIVAKAALGKGYSHAKAAFYNKLVDSPTLSKTLDKMSDEYLKAVFTPEELGSLRKVAAIQTIRGAAEKMGGQAGSARSNALSLHGGVVGSALFGAGTALMHLEPRAAAAALATAYGAYKAPQIAANAYLKHAGQGLKIPVAAPGLGQVSNQMNNAADTKVDVNRIRQYLINSAKRPGSLQQ